MVPRIKIFPSLKEMVHDLEDIILLINRETLVRMKIGLGPQDSPTELFLPESLGTNLNSTDNQKLSVNHLHSQRFPHEDNRLIITWSSPGMRFGIALEKAPRRV